MAKRKFFYIHNKLSLKITMCNAHMKKIYMRTIVRIAHN